MGASFPSPFIHLKINVILMFDSNSNEILELDEEYFLAHFSLTHFKDDNYQTNEIQKTKFILNLGGTRGYNRPPCLLRVSASPCY